MKRIIKNKYFIVTVLSTVIYLIYLKIMNIYPFGEYSILKSDLYQQYINFLCYLREVILKGKSILFSWNLGLANNFFTTFAYYLMSPLNLLVVFFSASNMDIFVESITLIKITLMANFMILFLDKSYGYKSKEAVIFGVIYAFSSYVMCYSFHIMWLDCVYMLPIVLLFVDKYLKIGKIWPFTLSLSYAILTNYYIGYIVAFFSGIYFVARFFITYKSNSKEKKILRTFSKFLVGIVLAFGIGMVVILPSILQLKGKMSAQTVLVKFDIEKIRLGINVIFNNYVYMFTQKSCIMFSSTLTILLLPLYYLNKHISKKEKIGFTGIIVFLLLPIISPFFNKLWHAFTEPNCFNYRYSFVLIFILVLMTAREFQNKKYTSKWHFGISAVIFVLLTDLEIYFLKKGYLQSDNFTVSEQSIFVSTIVYTIMFILVYIFCSLEMSKSINLKRYNQNLTIVNKEALPQENIYETMYCKIRKNIVNKEKLKSLLVILLIIIVSIDLLIAAKSGQRSNDLYFKRWIWTQYDDFMAYFMPKLKNPEIERIAFMPDEYGCNMSLKFGYSNIGFFTSARNRKTLEAMYRLGYNVQMSEQLWLTSQSGTFLNYDIAGVKYYITREKLENNEIYGFELDEKYGDFYVYKNKNWFNIGYYMAQNIKQKDNPFEMQNDWLNAINGTTENEKGIFLIKKENNICEGKYFEKIEDSKVLKCKKKIIYNEEKQECTTKYNIKAKKDCNIYLSSKGKLNLKLNEKEMFQDYSNIWSFENGIKQIKYLRQNEKLDFTISKKENEEQVYIYVSNNDEIQNVLDNMNLTNTFYNVEINNNGLTGIADFKDDGYLTFGIAFDDCWKIYVDGKEKDKEAIAGCFLGVKLEKGRHMIELKAKI